MKKQMDPIRAARLLEKWINFYGMDDPDAWPPEDYPQVKNACEAMRLAIDILRGNKPNKITGIPKAISLLEQWPMIHSMGDPGVWEPVDFPFVRNALEAIQFATAFLKEQQMNH